MKSETLSFVLKEKKKFGHHLFMNSVQTNNMLYLTPKGPRPFFGPFLKFGQAIVDAVFVQKISNFR
jgi:hypothetical protein